MTQRPLKQLTSDDPVMHVSPWPSKLFRSRVRRDAMILPVYSGHALVAQLENAIHRSRPWKYYIAVLPTRIVQLFHKNSPSKGGAYDSLALLVMVLQLSNLMMGQARHQMMHMPRAPTAPWGIDHWTVEGLYDLWHLLLFLDILFTSP